MKLKKNQLVSLKIVGMFTIAKSTLNHPKADFSPSISEHCRVQRVLHTSGNYILREMIHFHAFHLLNYRDNKSIICLKNTVKIPAILFHYHNDHCTLFMEGCSVFYRKVRLLGGPPARDSSMGGGRPAHAPCPPPPP